MKNNKSHSKLFFTIICFSIGFLVAYLFTVIQVVRLDNYSDAYVYVPDTVRSVPKYTDVKMFDCAWCKRTKNLNRHHIIPQSADPSLKNDYANIVVLCRDCHFVLGHKCNWKKFNPDVMTIVETYTNLVTSAEYKAALEEKENE